MRAVGDPPPAFVGVAPPSTGPTAIDPDDYATFDTAHAVEDAHEYSETTVRIASLVASVLKVESVDPQADLIELGINSLDMMRLANLLEQTFGFRPRMSDLFGLNTVAPR